MSGVMATEPTIEADVACALILSWPKAAAKRALDLIICITLLVLICPLLVVIACLIKLFDHGPLFYYHRRIGRNGQSFGCIKFRTMRPDADLRLKELLRADLRKAEEWNLTGKLRRDPRVTPLGSFLRKTSLDELPQLLNVLHGDMSLVGPRPVIQSELDLHYHGSARAAYFAVRPGITGLWQVSGRSDASYDRRVELDVEYVRNLSIIGDMALMARTVFVVLACDGAY